MKDRVSLCDKGGLRVLVVEDDADTADSLAELLRAWGHEAVTAADGPSALRAAGAAPPDVVLLDVVMPGMSGFEVASLFRDWPWAKRPFVIAVTGSATEDGRRRGTEVGFDLYLAKPADPRLIKSLLRRFTDFVA